MPVYTVYDRIIGDFPAKNTVYAPYIYGSGQRYTYKVASGQVGILNRLSLVV